MDNENKFYVGQIIKHFKRELCSVKEQQENKHLYRVIGIAKHSETGEDMLVYQGLYRPFQMFCRPLSMCNDPVDKDKYPWVNQNYRLEPWNEEEED